MLLIALLAFALYLVVLVFVVRNDRPRHPPRSFKTHVANAHERWERAHL